MDMAAGNAYVTLFHILIIFSFINFKHRRDLNQVMLECLYALK